jgi:hypothetical protein
MLMMRRIVGFVIKKAMTREDNSMRAWIMTTLGASALCAAAASAAHAAPIGSSASALRAATEVNAVEKIAYRRCWWRQGVRYCRQYRSAYYPYYGVPSNQSYSFGRSIGLIMGIQ